MTQAAAPAFPQAAYELLVHKVHRPFFLEKLASDYNIIPGSAEEEAQLLELAGVLREAHEAESVKQAAAGGGNSFLREASDSLKDAMAQLGYGNLPTSQQRMLKQAAARLAADQTVFNAVLQFGDYMAQSAA